jgi:hypothetical protein
LIIVLVFRFLHYISAMWIFSYIKCKKGHYMYPALQVSFVFMHIFLGDMLICLIYMINNVHCWWYMYIHTAEQMKIQLPKIYSYLSSKMSTLKPCNLKTSPMTPDFLYNFLTLVYSRNYKYTFKKMTLIPMSGVNPFKEKMYLYERKPTQLNFIFCLSRTNESGI